MHDRRAHFFLLEEVSFLSWVFFVLTTSAGAQPALSSEEISRNRTFLLNDVILPKYLERLALRHFTVELGDDSVFQRLYERTNVDLGFGRYEVKIPNEIEADGLILIANHEVTVTVKRLTTYSNRLGRWLNFGEYLADRGENHQRKVFVKFQLALLMRIADILKTRLDLQKANILVRVLLLKQLLPSLQRKGFRELTGGECPTLLLEILRK